MPNGHGGYRKPSHPAAVSGPGSLSQRTDGRPQAIRDLPNAEYGGNKDFRQIEQGAAMASSSPSPGAPTPAPGGGGGDPLAGLAQMGDPTAMPGVPVTDGADAGAGAGSSALGLPDANQADTEFMRQYLPLLIRQATRDDASPELKRVVRVLIAKS